MIATATWLPIGALPERPAAPWGWRMPFWLSAFVVLAGVLIRRRLDETPVFAEAAAEGELDSAPVGELLRDHRAGVLRVMLGLARLDREHDLRRLRAVVRRRQQRASTRRRCCGWRS